MSRDRDRYAAQDDPPASEGEGERDRIERWRRQIGYYRIVIGTLSVTLMAQAAADIIEAIIQR